MTTDECVAVENTTVASQTSSSINMDVYRTYKGFMGVMNYSETPLSNKTCTSSSSSRLSNVVTVIVLDKSGSMGRSVVDLVTIILPAMLRKLGYEDNHNITIITFESTSVLHRTTIKDMTTLGLRGEGGTKMTSAIKLLLGELQNTYSTIQDVRKKPLRILTVSDGHVFDQAETVQAASVLAQWVKDKGITVNSQAIRFITSAYGTPDTRALCSLLQLNSDSAGAAIDVQAPYYKNKFDAVADSFANAIRAGDGSTSMAFLKSASYSLLKVPWDTAGSDFVRLGEGQNIFWFSEIPTKLSITVAENSDNQTEQPVEITVHDEELKWHEYEDLLRQKIDLFIQKIKVLKIVNAGDSIQTINNMNSYFSDLQKYWLMKDEVSTADFRVEMNAEEPKNFNRLSARLGKIKTFVERTSKSLIHRLMEVANDDKVSQLNSAQQAEYLRSMDVTKNSKGLAKRALNSETGLDFATVIRAEVRAMQAHLDELKDVNDDNHLVSFYSFETTLAGIYSVCDLVKNDYIDHVSINDIFQLLNIVGIASSHTIGDYPDPMSYRPTQLFHGCYVSLSDILWASIQSGGQPLKVPGRNGEITNAVPVFEDIRILKFLRKYAPKTLELYSSIGMRRVVAEVNMTFGYTLLSGFYRSVEDLAEDRSQVALTNVVMLGEAIPVAVGAYFDRIDKCFKPGGVPQVEGKSYNLINNGISNMIAPLAKRVGKAGFDRETYAAVLRALYTFEVWQI
ncbi:hypothetical protein HDV05_006539, partial [Chytridiales sp. JEL 0842]